MIQPKYIESQPRIRNPRSAKTATQTRIVRNTRARYNGIVRVCAGLGLALLLLMSYVMLTSNLTSLTYAVANARATRDSLREETTRLDDRLAIARSQENLARMAAKLHMGDPQTFALVRLTPPEVAQKSSGFPVLTSLAGWFGSTPRVREH